jgi:DNA-binding Xre family transcriptional regulator
MQPIQIDLIKRRQLTDAIYKEIAENVRIKQAKRNLQSADVYLRAGISKDTYRKIKNGAPTDLEMIVGVAMALEVDFSDLLKE